MFCGASDSDSDSDSDSELSRVCESCSGDRVKRVSETYEEAARGQMPGQMRAGESHVASRRVFVLAHRNAQKRIVSLTVTDDVLPDCQKWYHTVCIASVPQAAPSEMEQLRGSGLGLSDDLPWLNVELGGTAGAGPGGGLPGDANADAGTPSTDDVDAEGLHDGSKGLIQTIKGQGGGHGPGHLIQVDAAAASEAESRERMVVQVTRAAQESILRGTAESGMVGTAKKVLSARELVHLRALGLGAGGVGGKVWDEMAKAWAAEYHVEEESLEDHPEGATDGVGGEGRVQDGRKKSTGARKKSHDRVAAAAAVHSHSHWRCPTCQNVI